MSNTPEPLAAFGAACLPSVIEGERGIGGRLKERPEDFLVEEQPLYQPSGGGEHAYLFVEKRGVSTLEMVGIIAGHFGVRERDVGYAGLKDKQAITRQVVSVWMPGRTVSDVPMLRHERVAILWADRHINKLRPGHLAGNRFSIRVRGVEPAAALAARRVLNRLAREGIPNIVGPQRFGPVEANHLVGRALILDRPGEALDALLGPSRDHPAAQAEARAHYARGEFALAAGAFPRSLRAERCAATLLARGVSAHHVVRALGRTALAFYASAFQSAVFNRVLAARLREGTLSTLAAGDLAFMHASRATFMVREAELADPRTPERLRDFEISPSGPMWGAAMRRAEGAPGAADLDALRACAVTPEDIERFAAEGGAIEGARRPLRVRLTDPEVEGGVDEHGAYVRCAFDLPRGSFATVVMHMLMGAGGAAPGSPPGGVEHSEDDGRGWDHE